MSKDSLKAWYEALPEIPKTLPADPSYETVWRVTPDELRELIAAQRQEAADEAYRTGYNTGFQKAKRISSRDQRVSVQLREIADKIDEDNRLLKSNHKERSQS